ncbi:MAG: hypothetical protein WCB19_04980 [Thermoplasmata archaeon]
MAEGIRTRGVESLEHVRHERLELGVNLKPGQCLAAGRGSVLRQQCEEVAQRERALKFAGDHQRGASPPLHERGGRCGPGR